MTTALCAKGPFGTCPREIFLSQTSPHGSRGTTARPPFGQKIVPIFWPAGKTEVFSGKFTRLWVILIMGRENFSFLSLRWEIYSFQAKTKDIEKYEIVLLNSTIGPAVFWFYFCFVRNSCFARNSRFGKIYDSLEIYVSLKIY
jgi:hypothetical protein